MLIVIAGIVWAMTTIGHFAVGTSQFLDPMLAASFDEVAQKVMHCVFHYVSTYLILSSAALLLIGFGKLRNSGAALMVRFIAVNYAVFGIWQLGLVFSSDIPSAPTKLFQWTFFFIIAACAWLGAARLTESTSEESDSV
jgi:hypothetical protein